MPDFFDTEWDEREADYLEGWEAMEDILKQDETWARSLFEQFHGLEV